MKLGLAMEKQRLPAKQNTLVAGIFREAVVEVTEAYELADYQQPTIPL